jgi:two-component sensor histidine kinase
VEAVKVAGGVCHRVKNDFQTIANILALSSAYATTAQDLVEAVEGRVMAMSLCYTLVGEAGQPPSLGRLVEEILRRNLWRGPAHLRLERRVGEVHLSLRLCSPLSLWLHEVIGNALRHGLEQVSDPLLVMEGGLDQTGLWLSITDNGPGLAPGFRLDRDSHLGLKLAQALAATDLRGNLKLEDARPGLRALLRVPAADYARLSSEAWW